MVETGKPNVSVESVNEILDEATVHLVRALAEVREHRRANKNPSYGEPSLCPLAAFEARKAAKERV